MFLSITLSGKFIGIVMLGWIVVGTLRAVLRLPLPMMRLALGWAIREGSFGRCAPVFVFGGSRTGRIRSAARQWGIAVAAAWDRSAPASLGAAYAIISRGSGSRVAGVLIL